MLCEDDSYHPGKSGSPSAEEDTGEVTSVLALVPPVTCEEVVDGLELPEREIRESTAPLLNDEDTFSASGDVAALHIGDSTPPLPASEGEFYVPDGSVTPPFLEAETVAGALWSPREAMEMFDRSLGSDGSGEVCRLLLFRLLERASSFSLRDCADLRAELTSTCSGLRTCGANPSGFEALVSDLLEHAESVGDQVVAPQRVEGVRTGLQAQVRSQGELAESWSRLTGDLERVRARIHALEVELVPLREQEQAVSAELVALGTSMLDSAAALSSLEREASLAEGESQVVSASTLLAEAHQQFASGQQVLREFLAERRG